MGMPSWPARREVTLWTWTQIELAMGGQTGPPYDENKMHVQVKQERNVWPSLRPGTNSVIDLSTPSPSPKKRKDLLSRASSKSRTMRFLVSQMLMLMKQSQAWRKRWRRWMDAFSGDEEWDWWFLQGHLDVRGLHLPGKIPSVAGKLRESIYQPSLENAWKSRLYFIVVMFAEVLLHCQKHILTRRSHAVTAPWSVCIDWSMITGDSRPQVSFITDLRGVAFEFYAESLHHAEASYEVPKLVSTLACSKAWESPQPLEATCFFQRNS